MRVEANTLTTRIIPIDFIKDIRFICEMRSQMPPNAAKCFKLHFIIDNIRAMLRSGHKRARRESRALVQLSAGVANARFEFSVICGVHSIDILIVFHKNVFTRKEIEIVDKYSHQTPTSLGR